MLRGFRWQLLALLIAATLFVVGLALRQSQAPSPPPTTTTQAQQAPSATPTTTATPSPTSPPATPVPQADTSPVPFDPGVTTYREALIGQVQRLNPVFAGLNPVDRDITALIFEGLTRIDRYGQAVPLLAESWLTSNDGREYVFILRQDILWQDGVPFNADDIVYTMSILSSPDFPGPAEVGAFWSTIETEKIDDYTVRFRLTQALSNFPVHLSIGILPYHALAGTTAGRLANHPFNLTPIGTGPYQLEQLGSRDKQNIDTVDLRVSSVYRQRPEGQTGYAIDRVRFQLYDSFNSALNALRSGDVHGLATTESSQRLPLLELSEQWNLYNTLEPVLGVLIYNWDEGDSRFFQDQRVRIALEIGLDRHKPVQRFLANQAVVANSPLIAGSWAYATNLPWPGYDIPTAQNYLATAQIIIGSGETGEESETDSEEPTPEPTPIPEGAPLYSFTILVPQQQTALVNIAQDIANQWQLLNLDVQVEAVDQATYQQRLESADFDAAIIEQHLGADPDVYAFWHPGQYPDGLNYGGMAETRISERLEQARRDPTGLNRDELYSRFQQEFVELGIALPLYYPLYTYAVSSDVEGVQVGFIGSPPDRFRNIHEWQLQTAP